MKRALSVAAAAALMTAAPTQAQDGVRMGYAAGFTVENTASMGLAASVSAEVPSFSPRVDFRVEGMFRQARVRDILFMGSLKFTPLASRPAFYGIGGVGTFLDNGANLAWSAGAGVDLARLGPLPVFIEYRAFFARYQFSSLSFGVSF